eukprot:761435-Hanusia_phi.AAC.2
MDHLGKRNTEEVKKSPARTSLTAARATSTRRSSSATGNERRGEEEESRLNYLVARLLSINQLDVQEMPLQRVKKVRNIACPFPPPYYLFPSSPRLLQNLASCPLLSRPLSASAHTWHTAALGQTLHHSLADLAARGSKVYSKESREECASPREGGAGAGAGAGASDPCTWEREGVGVGCAALINARRHSHAGVGDNAHQRASGQGVRCRQVVVELMQQLQAHPETRDQPVLGLRPLDLVQMPEPQHLRLVDDVVGMVQLQVGAPQLHPADSEGVGDVR